MQQHDSLQTRDTAEDASTCSVLTALVVAAAARTGDPLDDSCPSIGIGRAGSSFVAYAYVDFALRVVGRSGGLLLSIDNRQINDVQLGDVDRDGHNELIVDVVAGRGTGLWAANRLVYFFDDVRFSGPLGVRVWSYVDGNWYGMLEGPNGQVTATPMRSTSGGFHAIDEDGDGRTDRLDAVQLEWWGEPPDDHDEAAWRSKRSWTPVAPDRKLLAEAPAWANGQLVKCFGLAIGQTQRTVVASWRRVGSSAAFAAPPRRAKQSSPSLSR